MELNIMNLLSVLLLITMTMSSGVNSWHDDGDLLDKNIVPKTTGISCISLLDSVVQCSFPPQVNFPNDKPLPLLEGNAVFACRDRRVLTEFAADPVGSLSIVMSTVLYPLFRPELASDCRVAVRFAPGVCGAYTGVLIDGLTHVGTASIAQHLVGQECLFAEKYRPRQVHYIKDPHY